MLSFAVRCGPVLMQADRVVLCPFLHLSLAVTVAGVMDAWIVPAGVTMLLTLSVFQVVASDKLPVTSDVVPFVGKSIALDLY